MYLYYVIKSARAYTPIARTIYIVLIARTFLADTR